MVPAHVFAKLPTSEKKLWHSHVHEVHSGMLVLPCPSTHSSPSGREAWDKLETEAMREVVVWYGKIFHFWDVNKGEELPMGLPRLMGSLTEMKQLDVDEAMEERDGKMGVSTKEKRELRKREAVPGHEVLEGADSWWEEAKREGRGIYAVSGR
jgi:hypothetical protein